MRYTQAPDAAYAGRIGKETKKTAAINEAEKRVRVREKESVVVGVGVYEKGPRLSRRVKNEAGRSAVCGVTQDSDYVLWQMVFLIIVGGKRG